jgi:regulator of nucleoside diphosphate kinase
MGSVYPRVSVRKPNPCRIKDVVLQMSLKEMPVPDNTIEPATSHRPQRPPIVMTNSDRDSLLALLRRTATEMEPGVARFLREEIERADIVNAEISPTAVVLIGSTVKFIDHAALNIRQVTLVFPDEANGVDLVSVSEGLGSALIGLGPGQTIRWQEGQIERQVTVLATVLSEPNQR